MHSLAPIHVQKLSQLCNTRGIGVFRKLKKFRKIALYKVHSVKFWNFLLICPLKGTLIRSVCTLQRGPL